MAEGSGHEGLARVRTSPLPSMRACGAERTSQMRAIAEGRAVNLTRGRRVVALRQRSQEGSPNATDLIGRKRPKSAPAARRS